MDAQDDTRNKLTSADELGLLHAEFIGALDDELAAYDARKRCDGVAVGRGVHAGNSGGRCVYRFTVPHRTGAISVGRDVGFEAPGVVCAGTITERRGDDLFVALDDDLGQESPAGILLADARWLLVALRQRIALLDGMLRSGVGQYDMDAAARVVGIGDLSAVHALDLPAHAVSRTALNDEQRQLFDRVRQLRSVFLWGPPGTGKTESLIELILSLADIGLRVLYVAPTNIAVDDILERAAARASGRTWYRSGAILRLGPIDSLTLSPSLRRAFSLDELVRQRIGPLCDRERYRLEADRFVRSCSIAATTLHQTYLSPALSHSSWDVLVADEASMVSPIALYAAAALAEHTVIAGDFRQLPPIALASSARAHAWLRSDPFEVAGIVDDIERGDYPPYVVMLKQQYRMAPDICALVAHAYGHELTTHASVLERASGPLGTQAVLYVDSGACTPRVTMHADGSRSNEAHADLIRTLLLRAIERGALCDDALGDVLVITPFVAHARLLTDTLRRQFGRHAPSVRTVHRCQGREASVVVLDLVDAPNATVSRFLQAPNLRSEGGRLLTVAVSRAREHLVVVGDMNHLRNKAGAVVRELIDGVMAHGTPVTPSALRWRGRAA
jgi:hypothetical protein